MIDKIDSVVNAIGGFLYQPYIVPLFLIVAGLYFTIRTGLIQFRLFGESIHVVAEKPKEKGSISSFGALMVSTASRVGTGNIVGVSTAICLGGFGAVFWMWVVALLGGASAFIESALAQVYKKKDGKGGCVGGPSYYMEQALHQRWLGVIFAVVLILTYVVGYNMLASYNLQDAFAGFGFYAKGRTPYIIGAILAVLFAACVLGGGKRLTNITGVLVPVMGVLYILVSLVVIFMNIKIFPSVIANIFRDAFNFKAAFSGFAGSCIMWASSAACTPMRPAWARRRTRPPRPTSRTRPSRASCRCCPCSSTRCSSARPRRSCACAPASCRPRKRPARPMCRRPCSRRSAASAPSSSPCP